MIPKRTGTPLEVHKVDNLIIMEKRGKDFWDRVDDFLATDFEDTMKEIRGDERKRLEII